MDTELYKFCLWWIIASILSSFSIFIGAITTFVLIKIGKKVFNSD